MEQIALEDFTEKMFRAAARFRLAMGKTTEKKRRSGQAKLQAQIAVEKEGIGDYNYENRVGAVAYLGRYEHRYDR